MSRPNGRLARLLRLTPHEQRVVVVATLVLCLVSTMRRLMPRRRVHWFVSAAPHGRRTKDALAPERVVDLVDAMASCLPFASSCLDRAMAARWILGRVGVRATLVIGTTAGHSFAPHAWLELSDRVGDTAIHRVLWHST